MAIEILPTLPDTIFAGDTCKVRVDEGNFSAPEWDLSFSFTGPETFSVSAVDEGGAHLLTIAASDTATRKPGVYSWAAVATNDDAERKVILNGGIWIKPNPVTGSLSYAAECLQLIEAHIKGRLPAGLLNHTIAGNVISKISLADAEKLRDKYRAEVAAEQRALITAQGGDPDALQIEFTRP